mgnify:CR=1 FL=1
MRPRPMPSGRPLLEMCPGVMRPRPISVAPRLRAPVQGPVMNQPDKHRIGNAVDQQLDGANGTRTLNSQDTTEPPDYFAGNVDDTGAPGSRAKKVRRWWQLWG